MSESRVSSGRPRLAAVIRTRQPYVLFDMQLNGDYTVRLRYLSLNKGTNAAGDTEVLNFTSRTEIPIISEEYHLLLMYCAGKIIAGELMNLTDKNGQPRYPGMRAAYEYFVAEYENQLAKDVTNARRRTIVRFPVNFFFGGAERSLYRG